MSQRELLKKVSLPGMTIKYGAVDWTGPETFSLESSWYSVSYIVDPAEAGKRSWRLPGSSRSVPQQQIGLLPPHVPINVHMPKGRAEVLLCLYDPAEFESDNCQIDWCNERIASLLEMKSMVLTNLRDLIIREMLHDQDRRTEMLEAYGRWLRIHLTRECSVSLKKTENPTALLEWRLRKIYKMIDDPDNIRTIQIDDIATACRMSNKYLMMQFKAATGQTLNQYLEKVRIRRAKEMIEFEDTPLNVIADRLGFCTASHMSTTFAKADGVTPSQYRAHCRAERAENKGRGPLRLN